MDGERVRVEAFSRRGKVRIDLNSVTRRWNRKTMLAYTLSSVGERTGQAQYEWLGNGQIELPVGTEWNSKSLYDILCDGHRSY